MVFSMVRAVCSDGQRSVSDSRRQLPEKQGKRDWVSCHNRLRIISPVSCKTAMVQAWQGWLDGVLMYVWKVSRQSGQQSARCRRQV
jgi:hypothetical protein